jgi:NAD+ diphosphatase
MWTKRARFAMSSCACGVTAETSSDRNLHAEKTQQIQLHFSSPRSGAIQQGRFAAPHRAAPSARTLMQHDSTFPREPSSLTGFANNPLDRMAERRDEAQFVADLAAHADARCFAFVADVPLLKQAANGLDPFFTFTEAAALGNARELVFLGQLENGATRRGLFGRLVEADISDAALARQNLAAIDLRTIAMRGLLAADMIGALGQAKSLLYWHARHRFCSNCGGETRPAVAGWRRDCTQCSTQHFPRTDPVVIMLVTNGDTCLLGRQPRFPPGMYSCLAGFVEGGETLEQAVRREIREEAGINTGRVSYFASQPWPFPSSLMIGCVAEAIDTDITIDVKELEDARWFSREEVGMMFNRTHPQALFCPPKLAIANLLVWSWAKGQMD